MGATPRILPPTPSALPSLGPLWIPPYTRCREVWELHVDGAIDGLAVEREFGRWGWDGQESPAGFLGRLRATREAGR